MRFRDIVHYVNARHKPDNDSEFFITKGEFS